MRFKNTFSKSLIIICLAFFINACQNTPPQYKGGKTTFFDLKGYFKTEIDRLKTSVKQVKKTVTVNGQTEEKILDSLNFKEELEPFVASDINRPAWSDYYLTKITPSGNHGEISEYYALKDHLKTRSLIVKNGNAQLDMSIEILNAEKTVVTNAETRLSFNSQTGYTISTVQKLMGSSDTVKVEVQFLR